MRYQGRITEWNDDRGFGFVTPNGGGAKLFIHIKGFSNRQRRPVVNELVTFEVKADARGRLQGVEVAFVGDKRKPPAPVTVPGPGRWSLMFAGVFLVLVGFAVTVGTLPFPVFVVYVLASGVAYIAYVLDKAAAQKGQWRTPESSLHLFSLLGGWPGAMLAQKQHRHKTQKQSFQWTFRATVVLNCAALGWLFTPAGEGVLSSVLGGG